MKYIPSIAFEEMSGSAKGVTAAKNKGRKFIKNRGYGGRIGTIDQAKNKGVMKMITTKWKSLTNEQILAWNKLALTQDAKSVMGTKARISGLNLFQRLNFWVVKLGGNIMEMPPTLVGVETPSNATIVCNSSAFTFKLDQPLFDNGGIYLVIQASEGQSNGVSRGYGKAVHILEVEEPTDAVIDIKAAYESKHGALGTGAPKVFFKYFFVNSSTGETSVPMQALAIYEAEASGSGSGNSQSGNSESETVEAPVISGTTPFDDSTQVSISGPDGAEIRYTTDGNDPGASSTLYSAPFNLTDSADVKAVAIKNGVSSSVATKAFTKNSGGTGGGSGFSG